MTNKTYLTVGIVFLLIGLVLGYTRGSKKRRLYEMINAQQLAIAKVRNELKPVVFVNRNYKAWTLLQREDLVVRQLKERDRPKVDCYEDIEMAVDALVVSPIYNGEPVVKKRAILKNQENKCLFEIAKGKRALPLTVASLEGEIKELPAKVSLGLSNGTKLLQEARLLRSFQMKGGRTAIVELSVQDALKLIPLIDGKKVVVKALN
mgnify:CR=1 FL=1